MILYIDTTNFQTMRFALIGDKVAEQNFEITYNKNWTIADHLQKFLQSHKASPSDLTKIIVCAGPGSFNGTRVGVTIAEGLGFASKIPVVAIKQSEVPKDLSKLKEFKGGKKVEIEYTPSKFD